MTKIAIISPGTLPVPPVKGGAVENLIQLLYKNNATNSTKKFIIFSIYDEKAKKIADNFNNKSCEFVFIKNNVLIKALDLFIYKLAKLFRISKPQSFRFIISRIMYIRKVANCLYKNDYDKIVLENHTSLLWTLRLNNNYQKYAGRYYYHMHNKINSFYHCESIFCNSKCVIGVSKYILSTLPKSISNSINCKVLLNRVDEKIFQKKFSKNQLIKEKEKFHLKGEKIVLFTGRLNKEKGIKQLIEAWRYVKTNCAVLLIVGGAFFASNVHNPFEKELATLASSIKGIKFTGFVDYHEIPILYAISDLVVLPSVWDDPAPLTVIESITAGKPLITTNSGGIPEYAKGHAIIIKRDKNLILNLSKKN